MHAISISIFYFLFLFILLFIYLLAGPSSAHMGWARPSQPGPVTSPSQWPGWAKHAWTWFTRAWHCAKVINYFRTVLNALKFQKEWRGRGRESLPCRRLLRWSVSVLGEDQWRRPLLGNWNSSFYLCFPALCFFFSRLCIFFFALFFYSFHLWRLFSSLLFRSPLVTEG